MQETFGLVGRDFLFGTGKAFFEQLGPFLKNGCQEGGRRVFGEHGGQHGFSRGCFGKLAEQGVVGFDDGPAAPPVGGEDVDARFGRDGAQFRIGADLVK